MNEGTAAVEPEDAATALPQARAEARGGGFEITQWSLVMRAGGKSEASAAALEKLCRNYWPPIHAFVRREGYSVHDAQDLTQEFFCRLLSADSLSSANPQKGRFRSWLIGAMRHFLSNEWRKGQAQKRGSGQLPFSFDAMEPGQRERYEPRENETPERAYERQWAETLLAKAMGRLKGEFEAANQLERFDALKPYLMPGQLTLSYQETAQKLNMNEGAVRSAIYKIRQRFGILVRHEISQTVETEEDVEDELRCLLASLRGN